MSNPALATFDPFAKHPFTRTASARRSAPTRKPAPSPNSAPPPQTAVVSPQPRRPPPTDNQLHPPQSQVQPQPIFTPFKLERASPELQDVLAKKNITTTWPSSPPAVPGVTGKKAS